MRYKDETLDKYERRVERMPDKELLAEVRHMSRTALKSEGALLVVLEIQLKNLITRKEQKASKTRA